MSPSGSSVAEAADPRIVDWLASPAGPDVVLLGERFGALEAAVGRVFEPCAELDGPLDVPMAVGYQPRRPRIYRRRHRHDGGEHGQ